MDDDNDLGKRIKRLEADILDYKTTQPVGTDSVRTFTTYSNNIWDLSATMVGDEYFAYGQLRAFVRFKAAHQQAPFGRLRFQAAINGQPYNYATSSNNSNSSTVPYIFCNTDDYYAQTSEINDPQLLRFFIVASAPAGTLVQIKLFIDATDTGRLYWNVY